MKVGVPKEIKDHEYRVGLTPGAVREYVAAGHAVMVQQDAGAGIGATDSAYADAGAAVIETAEEVFSTADMIVKVKEPQPAEWAQLREGQILFTYLHLAPDPEQAHGLLASGCTAVAYETVTDGQGGRRLNLTTTIISITEFSAPDGIQDVKQLFRDYTAALGIDLSFQNFTAELDGLPGKYARPRGQILIARDQAGRPAGCVAMRPLDEPEVCEMKRLYVRPEARGCDLGRRLAKAIINCAKDAGYLRMRLDTLSSMTAARALYASLGFQTTEAYYNSPIPYTLYLALDL